MQFTEVDSSYYERAPGAVDATSAGGVVGRAEGGRTYIALVRERAHNGYVLPKGHVDPGESIEAAARREIGEEAGIDDLRLIAPLGKTERMNFERTKWKKIYFFLFVTKQKVSRGVDAAHHDFGWFSIDALPDFFWPEQRRLVESNRVLIESSALSDSA